MVVAMTSNTLPIIRDNWLSLVDTVNFSPGRVTLNFDQMRAILVVDQVIREGAIDQLFPR